MSFDRVVQTMKQTGRDLSHIYKETSEGGLAFFYTVLFQQRNVGIETGMDEVV